MNSVNIKRQYSDDNLISRFFYALQARPRSKNNVQALFTCKAFLFGDLWRCLAACRHPNSGAKTLCEEQVKTVSPARFPVIKEVSNGYIKENKI